MDTKRVRFAQPGGISHATILWSDIWPENITSQERGNYYLPGTPEIYRGKGPKKKFRYTRGSLNVKYYPDVSYEEMLYTNNKYGVFLMEYEEDKRYSTYTLIPYNENTFFITNKIKNDPKVEWAQIDFVLTANAIPPNDPYYVNEKKQKRDRVLNFDILEEF